MIEYIGALISLYPPKYPPKVCCSNRLNDGLKGLGSQLRPQLRVK
jgi:hypothetical protein